MEEIYEAAVDKANKISKEGKDSKKVKEKANDEDEGGKKSGTRLDNPTQDGDRQGKAAKRKARVDNLLDPNPPEPMAKEATRRTTHRRTEITDGNGVHPGSKTGDQVV